MGTRTHIVQFLHMYCGVQCKHVRSRARFCDDACVLVKRCTLNMLLLLFACVHYLRGHASRLAARHGILNWAGIVSYTTEPPPQFRVQKAWEQIALCAKHMTLMKCLLDPIKALTRGIKLGRFLHILVYFEFCIGYLNFA